MDENGPGSKCMAQVVEAICQQTAEMMMMMMTTLRSDQYQSNFHVPISPMFCYKGLKDMCQKKQREVVPKRQE